jgi:hypothetical protein
MAGRCRALTHRDVVAAHPPARDDKWGTPPCPRPRGLRPSALLLRHETALIPSFGQSDRGVAGDLQVAPTVIVVRENEHAI